MKCSSVSYHNKGDDMSERNTILSRIREWWRKFLQYGADMLYALENGPYSQLHENVCSLEYQVAELKERLDHQAVEPPSAEGGSLKETQSVPSVSS